MSSLKNFLIIEEIVNIREPFGWNAYYASHFNVNPSNNPKHLSLAPKLYFQKNKARPAAENMRNVRVNSRLNHRSEVVKKNSNPCLYFNSSDGTSIFFILFYTFRERSPKGRNKFPRWMLRQPSWPSKTAYIKSAIEASFISSSYRSKNNTLKHGKILFWIED